MTTTSLPMEGVYRSRVIAGCNVDELYSPPSDYSSVWVHIFCPSCGWTRFIPDDVTKAESLARSHHCPREEPQP